MQALIGLENDYSIMDKMPNTGSKGVNVIPSLSLVGCLPVIEESDARGGFICVQLVRPESSERGVFIYNCMCSLYTGNNLGKACKI